MFRKLNGPIGCGLMLAKGQALCNPKCLLYRAYGLQAPPTNLRSLEKHPVDSSGKFIVEVVSNSFFRAGSGSTLP